MSNRLISWLRDSWFTIRVVGTFVGLIFIFFAGLTWEPIASRFDVALAMAQASAVSSWVLLKGVGGVVGFPIFIDGIDLFSGDFRVQVSPACSGAVPSMIYLAAVLAYPTGLRARLIGAALGLAVIQSVNLIRVVALFLIGLFANQFFHETHVYIAQAVVIAVAVATWLFWAGRFADAPGR